MPRYENAASGLVSWDVVLKTSHQYLQNAKLRDYIEFSLLKANNRRSFHSDQLTNYITPELNPCTFQIKMLPESIMTEIND
jgi:hypothetical protein